MATLIPIDPKSPVESVPIPTDRDTLREILLGDEVTGLDMESHLEKITTEDGSSWWMSLTMNRGPAGQAYREKFTNTRARIWMTSRGSDPGEIFGAVLYLSPEETYQWNLGTGSSPNDVESGFEGSNLERVMKNLGAQWNRDRKSWMVPAAKIEEARKTLSDGDW